MAAIEAEMVALTVFTFLRGGSGVVNLHGLRGVALWWKKSSMRLVVVIYWPRV